MHLLILTFLFSLSVWSCRSKLPADETEDSMTVNEQETQSSGPLNGPRTSTPINEETGIPTVSFDSLSAINNASAISYTVSGSCSENNRTVTIGGTRSGSATCTAGSWSTTIDYSGALDGLISITADIDDAAGNNATQASTSVTKDSTPPGSPSIDIGSSEYTNTTANTIFLNATLSPFEMYLTNIADCTSGGGWEAYSNIRTEWILGSVNSLTAVYVKFRDALGNESSCVSDTITHDGIAPSTPGNLDDRYNTLVSSDSPNITWSASTDDSSGVAKYEISIGSTAGDTDIRDWQDIGIATSTMFTDLNLNWGDRYIVNVRAVDLAGNISSVVSSDGFIYGYVQEAYIKAANVDADDKFGTSVAISGNTMVVGAESEGSSQSSITNGSGASSDDSNSVSGAAYVYIRNGDTWTQQAYLKASNSDSNDKFGKAVAISDDTIVVGASQEQSNQNTITNGSTASDDNSNVNSGAVYVFRRSGTSWQQEAYIKSSNSAVNQAFGESVAIDGDTIVVGVQHEASNATGVVNGTTASNDVSMSDSGAAYVYRRTGSTWIQEAYLKASNTDANDKFGKSVDISGDTIVVGASQEQSNQNIITNGDTASSNNSNDKSGAVYVFKRTGNNWAQEAYIKAANSEADDKFGESVAIDGDTIVVGSKQEDSSASAVSNGSSASSDNSSIDSGAAYVYKRTGSTWVQEAYIKAPNNDSGDKLGKAVAIEGDLIAISSEDEESDFASIINGATADSDNSNGKSGAVYLFKREGVSWTQTTYLKASNSDAADKFGKSVGVSGQTVVVGASDEESNQSTISNGPQASSDNSADKSGAAYIFD